MRERGRERERGEREGGEGEGERERACRKGVDGFTPSTNVPPVQLIRIPVQWPQKQAAHGPAQSRELQPYCSTSYSIILYNFNQISPEVKYIKITKKVSLSGETLFPKVNCREPDMKAKYLAVFTHNHCS